MHLIRQNVDARVVKNGNSVADVLQASYVIIEDIVEG